MKSLEGVFAAEIIAAANRSAEVLNDSERGKAIRLSKPGVVLADAQTALCFDPWAIARCHPTSHRRAAEALRREGFEVWYPAGRVLSMMPMRFIGPKKRKRKQLVLREDVRTPYGDYLFIRRLFGTFDENRLYDLDGVLGLCVTDEGYTLMVHDYQIELLRLEEFDGVYDRINYPHRISETQLALAEIKQTDAAKERLSGTRRVVNVLDESRRTIQFIEQFGRIARVVTGQGDKQGPN